MSDKERGTKNRVAYMTVSMIFIVTTVFCALFLIYYFFEKNYTGKDHTALRDEKAMDLEIAENGGKKEYFNGIEIPSKELDWAGLKLENPDIFAYLVIPNTKVDDPVVRNIQEDLYLTHDSLGNESEEGAVFASFDTPSDMSGKNTVFYAKKGENGSLFSTLKFFGDMDFFDRTRYMFVYTPVKTYIYQIFAAYSYSDVPLVTEFSSDEEFKDYLSDIISQPDKNARFISDTLVKLDGDARILSCAVISEGTSDISYVVQGVLLNGEE